MFSGLSNRIQNDLIESVAEVVRSDIMKDISEASFVAVIVDETTDVTQKAQISVIFWYVNEKSHKIKKAFLGFDDVSDDRRADAIARYVLDMLEKFNCLDPRETSFADLRWGVCDVIRIKRGSSKDKRKGSRSNVHSLLCS